MSLAFDNARVWRLGPDIDTDALAPGAYMKFGMDVIAQHCLESIRPELAAGIKPGDVLVAGANFGIGSSREQAAGALVHLGVRAVVAPSFGGLFFRNAFNLGLLLLICERSLDIQEADVIGFNGSHINRQGDVFECQAIPEFLTEMVRAGGLLALLKAKSRFSTVV